MIQITATDLKANLGKYLALAETEDILITKSGKKVVKISSVKPDKVKAMESIFGAVPWNGEEIDGKKAKEERLAQKHEGAD
ncbi:MAG: type II toxin-antitoxin system prevent-host-death family antitoxin [Christensenellaceae bacterium]|jgi:prevent-host-death family protein|nr:type II toxin-antitoxin system prevent-host-death family antitoxin [Christensenellaceae bacterium]